MKAIGIALGTLIVLAAGGFIFGQAMLTNAFAAVPDAPEIGQPIPAFELEDYMGEKHSLEMYKDKILMLNFSSQQCPFSRGADATINALAEKYADQGVVVLGVDSNKITTVEEIKMHAEKAKVPYPILKDYDNAYADAVGARVTP